MDLNTYVVKVEKIINPWSIILNGQILTRNDGRDTCYLVWSYMPDMQIYYPTVIIRFDELVDFPSYVPSRLAIQEDWTRASQKRVRPATD